MASAYPGVLDSWVTNRGDSTPMAVTHPQEHDDVNDSLNKIEAELGTNPKGTYADVKTRLDALEKPPFNTQTSAYTLILADASKIVGINNASQQNLTVPSNASQAFPVGTVIMVRQVGAGQVQFVAAAGVTLHSRGSAILTAGQYAYAMLVKVATDTWELSGDIA